MSESPHEDPSHDSDEKTSSEYESPAIESVVTPNDLEREVQYAGTFSPVR